MSESRQSSLWKNPRSRMLAALPSLLLPAVAVIAPHPVLGDEQAAVVSAASADLEWGPCPEFMPERCAIALLHGDPAERNADVLFRLPAGATAPSHWHTSAERMVLISGEMEVRYAGQEPATVRAGDYAYGPPRLEHEATCRSQVDCVLFIAFEEPVDATPAGD